VPYLRRIGQLEADREGRPSYDILPVRGSEACDVELAELRAMCRHTTSVRRSGARIKPATKGPSKPGSVRILVVFCRIRKAVPSSDADEEESDGESEP